MTVRALCWDWNGTLLDDVDRCLRTMNSMLTAFDKPAIPDAARYRTLFRFPIQSFYADVGISDDEYRSAVDHYLDLLANDASHVPLHGGARDALALARTRGIRQVLASATQGPLLAAQLRPHDLDDAFDEVLSIDDAHNASKRDVIAAWLDRTGLAPHEVLLIGDTNHDHEISIELGTRFVHFSGGHQQLEGHPEVPRLAALAELAAHLG